MKRVFDFDGQNFCDNFVDEGLRLVVFVVPNASLDDYLRYGHGARKFAGEVPAAELEELLARSSARRAGAASGEEGPAREWCGSEARAREAEQTPAMRPHLHAKAQRAHSSARHLVAVDGAAEARTEDRAHDTERE